MRVSARARCGSRCTPSNPGPDPQLPYVQAANTDLCQLVAAAADICRKPLRHGVRVLASDLAPDLSPPPTCLDCCLRLEARAPDGQRHCEQDLDLELFQSGSELNLTISWCLDEALPLLWHGSHSVWMDAQTGERCSRPEHGAALEALARRLRSLLMAVD